MSAPIIKPDPRGRAFTFGGSGFVPEGITLEQLQSALDSALKAVGALTITARAAWPPPPTVFSKEWTPCAHRVGHIHGLGGLAGVITALDGKGRALMKLSAFSEERWAIVSIDSFVESEASRKTHEHKSGGSHASSQPKKRARKVRAAEDWESLV